MLTRIPLALALGFGALYLSSYSIGPTAQAGDRTGSPLTTQACSTCHNGGDYAPETQLSLLDVDGAEVTEYLPGGAYTLRVSIVAENAPAAYGFQAVVLDAATESAGAFGELPEDLKVTASDGRDYLEHRRRLESPSYDIPWTAPASGTGEVVVYAAGNAVNANNGISGDNVAEAQLALAEATTSATARALPAHAWRAYQSADGELTLDVAPVVADGLWFSVVDDAGRSLAEGGLAVGLTTVPVRAQAQLLTVAVVDGAGRTSSRRVYVR